MLTCSVGDVKGEHGMTTFIADVIHGDYFDDHFLDFIRTFLVGLINS